jgi:hypothetical protein
MPKAYKTKLPVDPNNWALRQCPCGAKVCNKTFIEPPGFFYQGSGFDPETAEFIVCASQAHDALVNAVLELMEVVNWVGTPRGYTWEEAFGKPMKQAEQALEKAGVKPS